MTYQNIKRKQPNMKEEDFIRQHCGKTNPFKVPEGYFENFTANLMEQLPQKQNKPATNAYSRWFNRQRITWYAIAAGFCGLAFIGTRFFLTPHETSSNHIQVTYTATNGVNEDTYLNDVLDYAMVSNQEIALYLTDVY